MVGNHDHHGVLPHLLLLELRDDAANLQIGVLQYERAERWIGDDRLRRIDVATAVDVPEADEEEIGLLIDLT
jgi:hypothetical protein